MRFITAIYLLLLAGCAEGTQVFVYTPHNAIPSGSKVKYRNDESWQQIGEVNNCNAFESGYLCTVNLHDTTLLPLLGCWHLESAIIGKPTVKIKSCNDTCCYNFQTDTIQLNPNGLLESLMRFKTHLETDSTFNRKLRDAVHAVDSIFRSN